MKSCSVHIWSIIWRHIPLNVSCRSQRAWNKALPSYINRDEVSSVSFSIIKWNIDALLVFARNSCGVSRQSGTGARQYIINYWYLNADSVSTTWQAAWRPSQSGLCTAHISRVELSSFTALLTASIIWSFSWGTVSKNSFLYTNTTRFILSQDCVLNSRSEIRRFINRSSSSARPRQIFWLHQKLVTIGDQLTFSMRLELNFVMRACIFKSTFGT